MIDLDLVVETERWAEAGDMERVAAEAAEAALAVLPEPLPGSLGLTILLAGDEAVRELNRRWRGQDKATNVLSFPAPHPAGRPGPRHLGDIALAFETVAREAGGEGKSVADHAAHLIVHGVLHLLGHDHATDEEADAMERLEIEALGRLGIANPYAGLAA